LFSNKNIVYWIYRNYQLFFTVPRQSSHQNPHQSSRMDTHSDYTEKGMLCIFLSAGVGMPIKRP